MHTNFRGWHLVNHRLSQRDWKDLKHWFKILILLFLHKFAASLLSDDKKPSSSCFYLPSLRFIPPFSSSNLLLGHRRRSLHKVEKDLHLVLCEVQRLWTHSVVQLLLLWPRLEHVLKRLWDKTNRKKMLRFLALNIQWGWQHCSVFSKTKMRKQLSKNGQGQKAASLNLFTSPATKHFLKIHHDKNYMRISWFNQKVTNFKMIQIIMKRGQK